MVRIVVYVATVCVRRPLRKKHFLRKGAGHKIKTVHWIG